MKIDGATFDAMIKYLRHLKEAGGFESEYAMMATFMVSTPRHFDSLGTLDAYSLIQRVSRCLKEKDIKIMPPPPSINEIEGICEDIHSCNAISNFKDSMSQDDVDAAIKKEVLFKLLQKLAEIAGKNGISDLVLELFPGTSIIGIVTRDIPIDMVETTAGYWLDKLGVEIEVAENA